MVGGEIDAVTYLLVMVERLLEVANTIAKACKTLVSLYDYFYA